MLAGRNTQQVKNMSLEFNQKRTRTKPADVFVPSISSAFRPQPGGVPPPSPVAPSVPGTCDFSREPFDRRGALRHIRLDASAKSEVGLSYAVIS